MANQHVLWNDPKVRAERQALVEAYMGRRLELAPLPVARPVFVPPVLPKRPKRQKARAA